MSTEDLKSQFLDVVKKRLSLLRKARGQTIKDVALRVGATREQYNQWELGKVPVPSYYLRQIADHFKVTVDYLVGGDGPPILGLLEEVIKELQWYKDSLTKMQAQPQGEDLMLEFLLRAGQGFVDSTASSIYLIDNRKNPSLLLKVLAIGYPEEKELTAPEQYRLRSESMGTTVKVFTDGNVAVTRSRQEVEHDIHRRSNDAGCGSYLIVPLWTMDADHLGVMKYENHVEDNPLNPFTQTEVEMMVAYSTIIAEFLKQKELCVASCFSIRTLPKNLEEDCEPVTLCQKKSSGR